MIDVVTWRTSLSGGLNKRLAGFVTTAVDVRDAKKNEIYRGRSPSNMEVWVRNVMTATQRICMVLSIDEVLSTVVPDPQERSLRPIS